MSVRLNGRFKLGLLAVPRAATGITHQVFFNTEGKRPELVVSDGRIMAVIPVDPVKGQETTRIDGKSFGIATSGQKANEERELSFKNGHILVKDDQGREMLSVPAGNPDPKGIPHGYRKAIPPSGSQQFAVALDPRDILKLARVLGADDGIVIHGDSDPATGVVFRPMRVSAGAWSGDDEPHGVILPSVIPRDRRGRKLELAPKK